MRKEYAGKIDILTVVPRSVKTQMNSGIYAFTIMPNMHARAVVEEVGRTDVTWGHYRHGLNNWLLGNPFSGTLIRKYDERQVKAWMARREAAATAAKQTNQRAVEEKPQEEAPKVEMAAE